MSDVSVFASDAQIALPTAIAASSCASGARSRIRICDALDRARIGVALGREVEIEVRGEIARVAQRELAAELRLGIDVGRRRRDHVHADLDRVRAREAQRDLGGEVAPRVGDVVVEVEAARRAAVAGLIDRVDHAVAGLAEERADRGALESRGERHGAGSV
jgi:hypothetical protein